MYGSFATGLLLPSSDLDVVLCLPNVQVRTIYYNIYTMYITIYTITYYTIVYYNLLYYSIYIIIYIL